MKDVRYYSIRMHASLAGRHVCGAERIVTDNLVSEAIDSVIRRTQGRAAIPDRTVITLDDLGPVVPGSIAALDLAAISVESAQEGRALAKRALIHAGIHAAAIDGAIEHIRQGAGVDGQNMRGAMLLDAITGERLEPDQARGIRASRFDWTSEAEAGIDQALRSIGLGHMRTREALALASKIARGPSVAGELCWSDDPDYIAGYAASDSIGYIRFSRMKSAGDARGGRAVFVQDRSRVIELIAFLQQYPVLVTAFGSCTLEHDLDSYLR